MKKTTEGITTEKEKDISEWYSQVCLKSELADYGSVKGTMIIRPRGYNIWQTIQDYFNKNIIDKTNTENAYFPLFIPESFFKKESQHAEGFTPEVAWLDKKLTGEGERLAIRPTSETIMYDSYSKWIRSYRDLPLKINQWCNVVRWETEATKLFLRSREFLWQEGHCVYESEEECQKDTINYINLYAKLCEELLALPVLVGKKTEKEKFSGAQTTYTIEAFMPDGKALQCGTSHELGQGFAKAFEINFLDKNEKSQIPWQNSWGLSTRLIGAVVMTHSDNKGLILPPKLVKNKVVIIPIIKGEDTKVLKKSKEIFKELKFLNPILDDRLEYTPGWKYNQYELIGIPLRVEIGPRDIEKNQAVVIRRDLGKKEFIPLKKLKKYCEDEIKEMEKALYEKSKDFLEKSKTTASSFEELKKKVKDKKIVLVPFCNNPDCEEKIKEEIPGIGARCISFNSKIPKGNCIHCKEKATCETYFSRSY